MSEENNNATVETENTTEVVKIAEPDYSAFKDLKTIVDKLSIKNAPISATM
jgi:hypothetical protein